MINGIILLCIGLAAGIGCVDRYFLKCNDGFCLHHIASAPPPPTSWHVDTPPLPPIDNQTFTYLGKGHQSYVFESSDQRYVLKFYRFPSHLRRFGSLFGHPLAYLLSSKRKAIKAYNLEKLQISFTSYKIAWDYLREESGLVYFHPHPTEHLHTHVLLVDKLGKSYPISLDTVPFLLQRKGETLSSALKRQLQAADLDGAHKLLGATRALIRRRCSLGIGDTDPVLGKNCGWLLLNVKPFYIDVGRFVLNPSLKESAIAEREAERLTQDLEKLVASAEEERSLQHR